MLLQQPAISGNASKYFADNVTISSSNILDADKTSRYKSIKLIGLHPLCAVTFTIGYSLREYGAFNYLYSIPNLIAYILSQVFIYVCP
jgi:hypothetical protein